MIFKKINFFFGLIVFFTYPLPALSQAQKAAFKCAAYKMGDSYDVDVFNKDVKENFKIDDSREDVENILIKECHAKPLELNVVQPPGVDKKTITYYLDEPSPGKKIPSLGIVFVYIDGKVWEVRTSKRVWPEEPVAIKTFNFDKIPSLSEIEKNLLLFKFEYFVETNDLRTALETLFPVATDQQKIENALIGGGKAKSGAVLFPDDTDNFSVKGNSYTYFLPTVDGREYEIAKRRIMAIYDDERKLRKLYLNGREIILKQ